MFQCLKVLMFCENVACYKLMRTKWQWKQFERSVPTTLVETTDYSSGTTHFKPYKRPSCKLFPCSEAQFAWGHLKTRSKNRTDVTQMLQICTHSERRFYSLDWLRPCLCCFFRFVRSSQMCRIDATPWSTLCCFPLSTYIHSWRHSDKQRFQT